MASTVRITGTVLTAASRSGVNQTTGQAWNMSEVLVFVGEAGIADVRLPKDWALPERNETVDYLAEASPRSFGGNLTVSLNVVGNFPVRPAQAKAA